MSNSTRRAPSEQQPRGSAGVAVEERSESPQGALCTCCDPKNPLIMRPDFGTLRDGTAEYALCVLHEPDPVVYRNRGDGDYVPMGALSLNAAGEIVDEAGNVVAGISTGGFQRLNTVDDDDPPPQDSGGGEPIPERGPGGDPARPVTYHVDLSKDDFYTSPLDLQQSMMANNCPGHRSETRLHGIRSGFWRVHKFRRPRPAS